MGEPRRWRRKGCPEHQGLVAYDSARGSPQTTTTSPSSCFGGPRGLCDVRSSGQGTCTQQWGCQTAIQAVTDWLCLSPTRAAVHNPCGIQDATSSSRNVFSAPPPHYPPPPQSNGSSRMGLCRLPPPGHAVADTPPGDGAIRMRQTHHCPPSVFKRAVSAPRPVTRTGPPDTYEKL